QQIDLIDGEEFITKLAEFGIGVKEVKDYEVNEEFFSKL
ncbi:MAG: restriction endonuclease, partial [Clostridia bacterium]|nr:restriction endonuclease [Clostridia bacterium]